ncbi:MAG: hypothetical protein QXE27_07915 [Thermoplasmata archaeon]
MVPSVRYHIQKRVKFHPEHEIARDAIRRQREREAEENLSKMVGIKRPWRCVIENVTPCIGLANTKIHIVLVTTLSNIMKAVRLAS